MLEKRETLVRQVSAKVKVEVKVSVKVMIEVMAQPRSDFFKLPTIAENELEAYPASHPAETAQGRRNKAVHNL